MLKANAGKVSAFNEFLTLVAKKIINLIWKTCFSFTGNIDPGKNIYE